MLDAGFVDIVVGVYRATSGAIYACQVFGSTWDNSTSSTITITITITNDSYIPVVLYDYAGNIEQVINNRNMSQDSQVCP